MKMSKRHRINVEYCSSADLRSIADKMDALADEYSCEPSLYLNEEGNGCIICYKEVDAHWYYYLFEGKEVVRVLSYERPSPDNIPYNGAWRIQEQYNGEWTSPCFGEVTWVTLCKLKYLGEDLDFDASTGELQTQ